MRATLLFCLAVSAITACNSDNAGGHGDHGDTTAKHEGPHHSAPATGTTGSVTMMDMMHSNMQQMAAVPSTNDQDRDFASLMRIHHQGAVEMAQALLAQGSNASLKAMAQQMITDQQREIASFDQYLSRSTQQQQGGSNAFHKAAIDGMNHMNMKMDAEGSIDRQFIDMMIPHHEGGIDMAEAYLKNGARDNGLKTIANNIISSQKIEINQMQAMLKGMESTR